MTAEELKRYIMDNDTEDIVCHILEDIGMWNIVAHDDEYISCSWHDGDNKAGCVVYLNTLLVEAHTRDISTNSFCPDIFTLVGFCENLNFVESMNRVCHIIGIGLYDDITETIPMELQFLRELEDMASGSSDDKKEFVRIRKESLLQHYPVVANDLFFDDNISYETQYLFEVGYDKRSNYISIPIRDELGNLVGVKGRLFKRHLDNYDTKYLYLEKTPRNQVLYGLNRTYEYIMLLHEVYVVESEKAVMQLWDIGYYNAVATSGSRVSKTQIEKLIRLDVDIIFAFDKDIPMVSQQSQDVSITNISNKFIDGVNIYAICDTLDILEEKESPTDNPKKWEELVNKCKYSIKGEK